jgi:pyruvate formate lyase activating enzyme
MAAEEGHLISEGSKRASGETGYVHSWETGSTVDGPGVRMVLWTTGCPMRCQYCHNPDTWKLHNGRKMRESEVMEEVRKYAHFLRLAGV